MDGMYKLLLVDDEKLERESISSLVDWEVNGISFIGAARNGVEAYDMIVAHHPDIVVTDIKMPVVSGIDLIEKAHRIMPEIIFVVLSGYGDYEFTSKAMMFGVRHYLLKPVGEEKIQEVLTDIENELKKRNDQQQKVNTLTDNLERILPHVKEQFLRGCALSRIYSTQDYLYFKSLFGIQGEKFIAVLLYIDKNCDFIDRYALLNIADESIGWNQVVLSTIIEDKVTLISHTIDLNELEKRLCNVAESYKTYFDAPVWAAVSDPGRFEAIHDMYAEAVRLLKLRFELPVGFVVADSRALRQYGVKKAFDLSEDIDEICRQIKAGAPEKLNCRLEIFFTRMRRSKMKIETVRNYCRKLLTAVLQYCNGKAVENFLLKIDELDHGTELEQFHETVKSAANGVVLMNLREAERRKNPIVESMLKCIYENISNPELSLSWIAHNILYMNEDYLGRLFCREMKEKFSSFILRTRIEMACRLMENTTHLKIYEISQMTGFSEDGQYFGKVFRSFTGQSPTEYRKKIEKKHL